MKNKVHIKREMCTIRYMTQSFDRKCLVIEKVNSLQFRSQNAKKECLRPSYDNYDNSSVD